MNNSIRKIIAVVLAFAMVLSTIAVHDINVKADVDWTGATKITLNGSDYSFKSENGFVAGFQVHVAATNWMIGDGFHFRCNGAGFTNVAVNGTSYNKENNSVASETVRLSNGAEFWVHPNVLPVGQNTVEIFDGDTLVDTVYVLVAAEAVEDIVEGGELLTNREFNTAANWTQTGGTYTNNGDGSVNVAVPAYTGGNLWDTQVVQTNLTLVNTKYYKATVTLASDIDKQVQLLIQKADYSGDISRTTIALSAGQTKTVEVVFKAGANNTVLYGIMMGYQGAANDSGNITISNVSLTGYNTEMEVGVKETIIESETESESEPESEPEEETTEPESESEPESEPEEETTEPQGPVVVDGTEILVQREFVSGNVSAWEAGGCENVSYNGDGSISMTLPARVAGAAHDSQLVQTGVTLIGGKYYKAKFTISSNVYRTIEFRMQTTGSWLTHHEVALAYVPANGTIDVEVIFQAKEDTTVAQYGIMLGYFEGGSTQAADVTLSDISLTVYNEQPAPSEPVVYPIGPSSVTASTDAPLEIDVSWVCDNAPAGQTYNVYLDDSTTPIATGITGTTYIITDVAEGDHTVTVEAVVGDKTSVKVKSAVVTVYPKPVLEEIASITAVGGMLDMTVSWTCPNASGLQTYNIYLNGSETATVTGIKANTYTLTLEEGTYSVTVKAALGEEISAGLTVSNVTVLGELPDVLTSDAIKVEGFQIKTNGTDASGVSFRTVCKAPNVGSTITVGDATYTVKSMGEIFVLDSNTSGYRKHDALDKTYTILNPTPVNGSYVGYIDSKRTKGYIATEKAVQKEWNPTDTENTYYVTTMTGMDTLAQNTMHVRAFVIATDSTGNEVMIYGDKMASTSIAQVASHIYTKSLAPNNSAHQYLYSAILNNTTILSTSNPYYRTAAVVYGWDNILYVPNEKTAILDAGTLEDLNGKIK